MRLSMQLGLLALFFAATATALQAYATTLYGLTWALPPLGWTVLLVMAWAVVSALICVSAVVLWHEEHPGGKDKKA